MEFTILTPSPIEDQFSKLRNDKPVKDDEYNWQEISPEKFDRFEKFLIDFEKENSDVERPCCFPTVEGEISAEWVNEPGKFSWIISVETNDEGYSLHALNFKNFNIKTFNENFRNEESVYNFYDIEGYYIYSIDSEDVIYYETEKLSLKDMIKFLRNDNSE